MGGSDHQHLDEGVTKEVAGQHAIGRNLAIDLDQMAAAVFQPAGDVSASCRIARRNGVDRTESGWSSLTASRIRMVRFRNFRGNLRRLIDPRHDDGMRPQKGAIPAASQCQRRGIAP